MLEGGGASVARENTLTISNAFIGSFKDDVSRAGDTFIGKAMPTRMSWLTR